MIRATPDAYVGLDDPTPEAWSAWHTEMLAERSRIEPPAYDPCTAWSDTAFRQLFLFMYDASFFDRRYRTAELIDAWRVRFGRVDEVILWQGYPRLGFDARTQFDFYRQMPGGLRALRTEVCDVLHAHGVRVLVDFNPWDEGTYDELGEIIEALGADGVMLDTLADVPEALRARRDLVLSPELRPVSLTHARQSWAQWFDVGDGPSIYRSRWLVPRHRQFAIARWDRSRRRDVVYSFFNGSGLVLWENVFGCYNPYSRQDRRLIAETAAIFDRYEDLFAAGTWLPLIPTGTRGLDANRFDLGGRAILTLRNRTNRRASFGPPGDGWFAFWGDTHEIAAGQPVHVEPEGTQALVLDDPERARDALAHFERLSHRADHDDPEIPRPRLVAAPRHAHARQAPPGMVQLPGGDFRMRVRHERRECGCYPLGATDDAMWGWHHEDTITHDVHVVVQPFAIRATAVTRGEFLAFVEASGYTPEDEGRFLAGPTDPALPVTCVSLPDARAFAAFYGQRLPTEAEWQWAAEGGRGHRFPWGNDERRFPRALRPARDESTATPQGVMGLSGNAWELTDSEHTDGHTRFVMLRGGVYLPERTSEWLVQRGARPNDSHAKYILMADGLDRSETLSFRTVT